MRYVRNYWLRWFIGSFVIGAVVPPALIMVSALYSHAITTAHLREQGIPTTIVTNPLVEITAPGTGKVLVSGYSAWLIMSILAGLIAAGVGLGIAGVKYKVNRS